MTTTTGEINKTKRELQDLRDQYMREADPAERERLALMIQNRKDHLITLGAGNG